MKLGRRRRAEGRLSRDVAPGRGMNLAPLGVEHAHGDSARRPIRIHSKLDRPHDALIANAPFANDIARTVEELDSELHAQRVHSNRRRRDCASAVQRTFKRRAIIRSHLIREENSCEKFF